MQGAGTTKGAAAPQGRNLKGVELARAAEEGGTAKEAQEAQEASKAGESAALMSQSQDPEVKDMGSHLKKVKRRTAIADISRAGAVAEGGGNTPPGANGTMPQQPQPDAVPTMETEARAAVEAEDKARAEADEAADRAAKDAIDRAKIAAAKQATKDEAAQLAAEEEAARIAQEQAMRTAAEERVGQGEGEGEAEAQRTSEEEQRQSEDSVSERVVAAALEAGPHASTHGTVVHMHPQEMVALYSDGGHHA